METNRLDRPTLKNNPKAFLQNLLGAIESSGLNDCDAKKIEIEFGRYRRTGSPRPRAVFSPLHYEKGYAYPLVVWLHGANDDERQLRRIMPIVSMRNYVAIAPRGTSKYREEHVSLAGEAPAKTASSNSPSSYGQAAAKQGFCWQQSEIAIDQATEEIFQCIAFASRNYHISEKSIFIGGYQSGGTMALRIAMSHPETFGGVLSINGGLPSNFQPLRNINRLRSLPLLLSTGRDSKVYPETQLCQDLQLTHAAGMSVSVRQYPSQDELTTQMLSDANCWMMEHVCRHSSTSTLR